MNLKSHLRVGALMLGLSMCGGLLTTSAHAAPGATAKAGKGHHENKMMKALNLTDAQKAQLKPIMAAQKEQMKALKADTTLAPKDKKAKMKAMHADTEAKVNAILTPAQQQQMATMKAQKKAERKAAGKGKKGKPRALKLRPLRCKFAQITG